MATDNKYINYNLSLVDPYNIKIENPKEEKKTKDDIVLDNPDIKKIDKKISLLDTPNLKKEGQDVIILNPVEEKESEKFYIEGDKEEKEGREIEFEGKSPEKNEKYIEIETVEAEKEEVNISSYAKEEEKYIHEKENEVDISLGWELVGLAREYPMEEIDSEFKTHLMESGKKNKYHSKREYNKLNDEQARVLHKNSDAKIFDVTYANKGKDDEIGAIDLSEIEPKANMPYSDSVLSKNEIISKLNTKDRTANLGALHVYPANPSSENGIAAKYIIPFEFNPKITESGTSAKFETTSILSRTGDIYSYVKTDIPTITLNTKYQVLSENPDKRKKITKVGDNGGVGSWMELFHLRTIQWIELALRGLTYPQTSEEQGSFFRPPIVKIVFGNDKGRKSGKASEGEKVERNLEPFNNMLKYPYSMNKETKMYHKTFIVSKVDIRKNWDVYPVILSEDNNNIIDLQGFDVSLNLMEIDPMYIGVLPSFKDYYSVFGGKREGR